MTQDLADARGASARIDVETAHANYNYDEARYLKHSSTIKINPDPVALKAFLVLAEHAIEKGLAIESPRPGFGSEKIHSIILAVTELERSGHSDEAVVAARACLKQYLELHDNRKWSLAPELDSTIREFLAQKPCGSSGGTIPLTRTDVEQATSFDYDRFIFSRHSVRHFTGEPIARETIRDAVRLAIKSPRVCNREARHVYVALDPEVRSKLLTYHHGHAGFDEKLGAVFVVTVDVRHYHMIGERNQGWIDGGLFAMSLCYALHSKGLGTCMMNWSEPCSQDIKLREAFEIPDNEIVITFLGAGHIPPKIDVAYSMPPDVDEVLSDIQERS